MIDTLKGVPENQREDGYRPEEWIGSCVTAVLGMKEAPNEGLSLVRLPSGVTIHLKDIIEFCPAEILGNSVVERFGSDFPVLTKFLDSAERLPGQFHPSAEFIKGRGMGNRGKKEAWLILDVRSIEGEEPSINLCFNETIDKSEFISLVNSENQQEQLKFAHTFKVSPGDVWLVEEGQYHAIGSGVFMVEVQESSDWIVLTENKVGNLTLDEEICYMNLSKEEALECADFTGYTKDEVIKKYKKSPKLIENKNACQKWELVDTDRFRSEKWIVSDRVENISKGFYRIGIVVKGQGLIESLSGSDSLKQGDSFLIPASSEQYSLQRSGNENLETIWSLPSL
ncbi:class I mannose-6-phosphate isomerase [Planctomycetota bacterium]